MAADDTRIRVTIWNSVPAGLPKEELSFANVLRDEVRSGVMTSTLRHHYVTLYDSKWSTEYEKRF